MMRPSSSKRNGQNCRFMVRSILSAVTEIDRDPRADGPTSSEECSCREGLRNVGVRVKQRAEKTAVGAAEFFFKIAQQVGA